MHDLQLHRSSKVTGQSCRGVRRRGFLEVRHYDYDVVPGESFGTRGSINSRGEGENDFHSYPLRIVEEFDKLSSYFILGTVIKTYLRINRSKLRRYTFETIVQETNKFGVHF